MAVVEWSKGRSALPHGQVDVASVVLPAAADTSEWRPVYGDIDVLISGGTAFVVRVWRATIPTTYSDAIIVDSQDETERAAKYDFSGGGYCRVELFSVTAGPVTVRFNG